MTLKSDKPGDKSESYSSFLKNVNEIRELDQLPVSLSFGQDINVDQFMRNQAKWHKSCHLKFCVINCRGQERGRELMLLL